MLVVRKHMTTGKQDRIMDPARQQNRPYLDRADIVIIGNGIAGLTAAIEARGLAPDKRIVMITDQTHPTINTPALKQFAIGKLEREQLLAYPAGTERAERIHVVTAHVEEIHANSKYVTLSGNRGFGYDSLLLATGSTPMGLPDSTPGRNFDGVLTLHRLRDYLDFRRRLPEVSEAVVIGGGVHAIETVMNLLYWGIHVNWLIRSANFMPKVLDEISSEMVLERVRRAGVSIRTETEVVGVVGRIATVSGVITNHQEMIPCQMVLTCTGVQPVTWLAERCSIPIRAKRGIIVDDKLRTSVRDIYAAGDAAALKNPQTGNYEPRALWYAAVSQGKIAGAMLAGRKDLAEQPFGAPWQATHLGELFMLSVGDPMSRDPKVTTLTDTSQGGYRRMTIADDRLIGYLSLGMSQPDSLAIKRIIDEGYSVRNITRALLKGKFDARQYLSQMRSRVAENMISSGRSPAVSPPREWGQMPPQPYTGAMPAVQPETVRRQETPRPAARREEPAIAQEWNSSPIVAEEISPFSGNLPAMRPGRAEEAGPAMPRVQVEEVNPFSGNLPPIAEREIEYQPPTRQNASQSLWTYSEATTKAPARERTPRNLWSYSNPEKTY
jgi:NADPH-dependent 2,4-dienoyl-CoA reductase/sulfur reductase-like enzyme